MTGQHQRGWFSGSSTDDRALDEARSELERLAAEKPFLEAHAAVLTRLLPALCTPNWRVTVHIDENRVLEKLGGGTPILRGELIEFDETQFKRHWRETCQHIEQPRPWRGLARRATSLARLLERDGWSSPQIVDRVLAGKVHQLVNQAQSAGLAEDQLRSVLRFALFPLLHQARDQAAGPLPQCRWKSGCCPSCGSWPLLSELRGLELDRYLRCGLCAAQWQFPRLQCPYCMTRDHHKLGYLQVTEEADRYRVATCEVCQGYLKSTTALSALSNPQLFVTDLATLHLDLTALDRGYRNDFDTS